MSERKTRTTLTFMHPFTLTAVDEPINAGAYVVETLEETVEGVSFVAYRRVSTTMTICSKVYGASWRQVIEIDAADLELAIARDKEIQVMAERKEANVAAARLQH